MLKRVQFDEWQALITIAAFVLCFAAFLYFSWRAIRMSKRDQKHHANLPLESENPDPSSHEPSRK